MESGKDDESSKVTNESEKGACTVDLDMEKNSQISTACNVQIVQSTVSQSQEHLLTAETDFQPSGITSEVEEDGQKRNHDVGDISADKESQIGNLDTIVIDKGVPVTDINMSIIDEPKLEPININTPEKDSYPTQTVSPEKIDATVGTLYVESGSVKKNDEAEDLIGGTKALIKAPTCEAINDQADGQGELMSTSDQSNTVKNQISDNKTLNENILNKSTELVESMETQNEDSVLSKQTMMDTKIESDKPSGSSLGLLAQYTSDGDCDSNANDADCEDDDVVEIPLEASKDYRNKVVEIKSESESESSSSDDSDLEYLTTIRKEIQKTIDLDDDEDDDEDIDGTTRKGKNKKKQMEMRVKGELFLEDLPPIQDLHITVPEEECIELGKVHSIVDQLLLVSVLPDSLLLDLETVLFLEKGKRVLGEVFDVLGQVADPLYCVRFNSNKEIEEKGIKIGDTVYVAPKTQYTQFVILSNLMKLRGSDASWENDVEPPPRYIDYSDDEQEREANARLRNQDRPNDHDDPVKRPRSNYDNDAASSSSISSSQPRNRTNQNRPSYQRNHVQQNSTHRGSWHSNYRQPYSQYSNMHRMPQQAPNAMQSPYQLSSYQPYLPGPFTPAMPPPNMQPTAPPPLLPMYVLNPLAVAPRMSNNIYQHIPQSRNSPPPAPPGLE